MNKKNMTMMENIKKNIMRKGSSLVYVIFFMVIFLALAAFAVDGAIVFTNRVQLQNATEMTALAAAAEFQNPLTAAYEFHSPPCANIEDHIRTTAKDTFNLLNKSNLKNVDVTDINSFNVNVDMASTKVTVNTMMVSEPFFLTFLGVSGIKLEAKACAKSEDLPITANYSGINWLTTKAAYKSDILSKDLNMNDTSILMPLGMSASASYYYISGVSSGYPIFNLINAVDSPAKPLSLGPGGFITIKLPTPIIDKPGNDLSIIEAGDALEGYMVFAGLDNDPTNPYVDKDKPGGGISWVNISSSGTSSTLGNTAHQTATTQLDTPVQDKFYGSGDFDLGKSGISMAKYIRIVDDNHESGFIKYSNGQYYKTMLYGEASTATSGADIDAVNVLNHVRLIP